MQEIIIAIVLGIIVGCTDRLTYNVKKMLNHLSMLSLLVMLFCLGAKIGCDEKLLMELDSLGGKSLIMALFIIAGSAVMLWILLKLFPETAASAEGGEEQ